MNVDESCLYVCYLVKMNVLLVLSTIDFDYVERYDCL